MKPTSINVQITKSPKQFEAVRLGMEATIDAGETVESAIKAATEQLNALYAEMYTPNTKPAQTAEKPATTATEKTGSKPAKKELLTFGDPRVQQIVTRIEKAVAKDPQNARKIADEIITKAREWYEFDDKVETTLELTAKVV